MVLILFDRLNFDEPEMASHIVGYPSMGPKRELKFALESFWNGKSSADELQKVAADGECWYQVHS
jgi:hypothetical protein